LNRVTIQCRQIGGWKVPSGNGISRQNPADGILNENAFDSFFHIANGLQKDLGRIFYRCELPESFGLHRLQSYTFLNEDIIPALCNPS
jgi:hypothetical protein